MAATAIIRAYDTVAAKDIFWTTDTPFGLHAGYPGPSVAYPNAWTDLADVCLLQTLPSAATAPVVQRPTLIPLVAKLCTTAALVGSPEELGGYWLDQAALSWATTATLRVYLRTSDSIKAASVRLYDADAAVYAAPQIIGTLITSASVAGTLLEVDVSALLTNAGGAGTGWLQLQGWSAGAIATVGSAEIEFE